MCVWASCVSDPCGSSTLSLAFSWRRYLSMKRCAHQRATRDSLNKLTSQPDEDLLSAYSILKVALPRYVADSQPHRTGVENTSCATCHRFNQQGENFHNLSYFEGAEMTISPRARRDVEHELAWLRQWIKSDGGVFDLEIAGQ